MTSNRPTRRRASTPPAEPVCDMKQLRKAAAVAREFDRRRTDNLAPSTYSHVTLSPGFGRELLVAVEIELGDVSADAIALFARLERKSMWASTDKRMHGHIDDVLAFVESPDLAEQLMQYGPGACRAGAPS